MRLRISANWGSRRPALSGLAWLVAAFAWSIAAAVGVVMALIVAASVIVIGLMASALVILSGAAMRARQSVKPAVDPDLIEAHKVGGHSWVAYGYDQQP